MPLKTFNPGDVLTSSDVNTYLMKQAVIKCTSGTRPSSPADGDTIYETDTDLMWTHNGSGWTIMAGNRYRVQKSVDETVNATVLQDDDHLFLSVAANAVFDLRLRLFIVADGVGDFKCGWSYPSGTSMHWTAVDVRTGTTDGKMFETDVSPLATNAPTWQTQTYEGTVATGGTAGTLRLRWAQNGAAVGGATVQSGSVLQLERIS